tara:strand:- start:392 stop:1024 length:633 start_codon:yes stop_codon:yes gene_type:complete
MKCPNCDKELTDKTIKKAMSKYHTLKRQNTENYNIYCDKKCFYEFKGWGQGKRRKICPECGQQKSRKSRRCQSCIDIAVSVKWLDSEIRELVILNSGAGFDYFIDTVFQATNKKKHRSLLREKLTYFLNDLEEIEGIDYVAWLQNPGAMRLVRQDKIPAGFEKYARGQRRSIPSNHLKRRRIREGLPTRNSNHVMIKIPREFRWGKYEPR